MNTFKRRMTEVWVYPQICKHRDGISDTGKYLSFLDTQGQNKDLLIYFHIPFCETLCFFCSYYKEPLHKYTYEQKKRFFNNCRIELENYAKKLYFKNAKVKAVQFGGGTPSAIEPEFIDLMINTVKDCFDTHMCEVISMEGNVASLQSEAKLNELKGIGIKRISFGVQTLNENIRKKVGIKAKTSDVFKAVETIKKVGFEDFSLDLMYNLPEQTIDDMLNDIRVVDSMGPAYIDVYNLNVFPNTRFKEYIDDDEYFADKPTDEKEIIMFKEIMKSMSQMGYNQVMVNTFSKYKKSPPKTLDLYLNGSDVLGIGPSSRSYLNKRNFRNIPDVDDYNKAVESGLFPVEAGNIASDIEDIERKLVFFSNYTYIKKSEITNLEYFSEKIRYLIDNGLAKEDNEYLYLTEEGKAWPGNISLLFFNEKQRNKRATSFIDALKYKENPYNQDRMGIF